MDAAEAAYPDMAAAVRVPTPDWELLAIRALGYLEASLDVSPQTLQVCR